MTALSAMKKGAEAISNSVNGTAEQKAKKVKKLEKKYKKDLKREPKNLISLQRISSRNLFLICGVSSLKY